MDLQGYSYLLSSHLQSISKKAKRIPLYWNRNTSTANTLHYEERFVHILKLPVLLFMDNVQYYVWAIFNFSKPLSYIYSVIFFIHLASLSCVKQFVLQA